MSPTLAYTSTLEELTRRILALIPDYPEILEMVDAFDLSTIDGFECGDLEPSYAQAAAALHNAKLRHRKTA